MRPDIAIKVFCCASTLVVAMGMIPMAQAGGISESDLKKALGVLGGAAKVVKASGPISAKDEIKLGRGVSIEVFKKLGPISKNRSLNNYVNLVGHTVVKSSGRARGHFRFAVIDNKSANAFAAPGGYVFITTGLVKRLGNEAQLAGVLGHEIAHVTKEHMLKAIKRQRQLAGAAEIGASLGNQNPQAFSQLVNIGSDILFTKGLDKKMEYEADQIGVGYAARSGYDSKGLVEFLTTLMQHKKKGSSIFFSTHPPVEKRISLLNRNIVPKYSGSGQRLPKRFVRYSK